MFLKVSTLQESLRKMKEMYGYTWQGITLESSVHNIRRIAYGKIVPTAKTWCKLHQTFPELIPEPAISDEMSIYKSANTIGKNPIETNSTHQEDGKYLRKLTKELMIKLEGVVST